MEEVKTQSINTVNKELRNQAAASNFEASVMQAAQKQASQIMQKAKEESEELYNSILSQDKGDPVKAHETELYSTLRKSVANIKQENLKKLVIYRKQLVNGLFAECSEQLYDFTQTKEYAKFLQNSLKQYMQEVEDVNGLCKVLLRSGDELGKKTVKKLLPDAEIQEDSDIKIGGAKLICGRILYNETLDDRLHKGREKFLLHCELHIDVMGLE